MAIVNGQSLAATKQQETGLCPKCHSERNYKLGDGRCMCRQCRTKYTPVHQGGKLPESVQRGLAAHFWTMTPIDTTAHFLEINRKTVKRNFGFLRSNIARHCERLAAGALDSQGLDVLFVGNWRSPHIGLDLRDRVTVFAVAMEDELVRLVFARSWIDWTGLDLSSLRVQAPPKGDNSAGRPNDQIRLAQAFWLYARNRLRLYRGGFLRRFPIYMREMEFRYNHRQDDQVVQYLSDLLKDSPV